MYNASCRCGGIRRSPSPPDSLLSGLLTEEDELDKDYSLFREEADRNLSD